MKICPKCQAQLSDTVKFCNECGFNLKEYEEKMVKKVCKKCGAALTGGKYCGECGASIEDSNQADSVSMDGFDFGAISSLATGQLFEKEGFEVDNGVLIKYTGKKRSIIIPSSIEEIYDSAFENNAVITLVDIEEGVRFIGKRAFANCESLQSLSIPSSVRRLYPDALCNTKLEELFLAVYSSRSYQDIVEHLLSENTNELLGDGSLDLDDYLTRENGKYRIDVLKLENDAEAILERKIAEAKRRAEAIRLAEEARIAEEAKIAEEKRKAEERKKAEEKRKAEEKKKAEEKRKAEEKKKAEEKRKAEERLRQQQYEERSAKWYVGSIQQIGMYPKSSTGTKMPIDWVVISRSGEFALVMTKQIIDVLPYNTTSTSVTWEKSTARKWLNNTFYSTVFSAEEKKMIASGNMPNYSNSKYNTPGGNKTTDAVFFLSCTDIDTFLKDTSLRKAYPTDYAKARGVYVSSMVNTAFWWSCSPGENSRMAVQIDSFGFTSLEGCDVSSGNTGIRPAMWVFLK